MNPATVPSFAMLLLASCTASVEQPAPTPVLLSLTLQPSGSTASLRGVSAVSERACWASGADGTVLRTTDGGSTWQSVGPDDGGTLDFRDIHAFDERTALVLSAGEPARMFRTGDAGVSWALVYENDAPGVFFDAMDFWDDSRGIAFSDPIDDRLLIIATDDGGRSWQTVSPDGIPPALPGEAGFAASGTCLATAPSGRAWIGLGGQTSVGARVFATDDWGRSWLAAQTPIASGPASGIFSLAFLDDGTGIAVGGTYTQPHDRASNAARSADWGDTWHITPGRPPSGYRSGVSVFGAGSLLLAVGTSGVDRSDDAGASWEPVHDGGFHAIGAAPDGHVGWAVGADGRIARLNISRARP